MGDLAGDFFLASTLCSTITKLVLHYVEQAQLNTPESNEQIAQSILLFVSILRVGTVANAVKPIDPDSHQRIRRHVQPDRTRAIFLQARRVCMGSEICTGVQRGSGRRFDSGCESD